MKKSLRFLSYVCSFFVLIWPQTSNSGAKSRLQSSAFCDPGLPVTHDERAALVSALKDSKTGTQLLQDFEKKYGSLDRLLVQWNNVSYSQLSVSPERSLASVAPKVCIHLTHRLPDIEHIADLAHELVHATRLSAEELRGDVKSEEEFVSSRIRSRGGEAEAFAVECQVKYEINSEWDELCSPYVRSGKMQVAAVIEDLYNGNLSASLTGEAYPKMLAKQFRIMRKNKQNK